ncbi:MAG: aspartate/glutamate racemase family protein, partial [Oscillospiraceae bacterium]|nr:aspartate/glutamate racemase family protein [Oscillospiraceae bacterium]
RFPGKTAAILATDGTVQSGLYDRALDAEGVRWMHPGESEQKSLMHLIYGVVKASRPMEPEKERWDAILDTLRGQGADLFILGCTELPVLAGALPSEGPFLDPTDELAKAAIRFCGYEVKE